MNSTYKMAGSALLLAAFSVMSGCQKMDEPKLGDYPQDSNPPGGPLKFYAAFDGTAVDSMRANYASENTTTFTEGINGQAMQGAHGKWVKYPSANDFKNVTSFTVAFWMKAGTHTGGAEFVFSLPSDPGDKYWHSSELFMLIEDWSTTAAMQTKFVIQDQWFEFINANALPNVLDNSWHHLAFVYDEITSKLTVYIDGTPRTGLPSSLTDVKSNGNPRGALSFTGNQFVIGGLSKHIGVGGTPDGWMANYSGALDQFRLYGTALTEAEIDELVVNKK